jgi:hypothetical protein
MARQCASLLAIFRWVTSWVGPFSTLAIPLSPPYFGCSSGVLHGHQPSLAQRGKAVRRSFGEADCASRRELRQMLAVPA